MSHLVGRRSDAAQSVVEAMSKTLKNTIAVSRVSNKPFLIRDIAFELSAETPPLGTYLLAYVVTTKLISL